MRAATLFLTLLPALAVARPSTLVARQEEGQALEVPEGPLPACSAYCFGRWGWPITLCTGQEGLNHLIECFNEECEDEPSRVHAQLAAEQNCEEGMGWPDRTGDDVDYVMPPAPAAPSGEDSESESEPSASASASTSASASGSESESASPTSSGVNTGGFDVENPGASGSPSPSATDSPNAASARQTAYVGYAGVAAAVMAFAAL